MVYFNVYLLNIFYIVIFLPFVDDFTIIEYILSLSKFLSRHVLMIMFHISVQLMNLNLKVAHIKTYIYQTIRCNFRELGFNFD